MVSLRSLICLATIVATTAETFQEPTSNFIWKLQKGLGANELAHGPAPAVAQALCRPHYYCPRSRANSPLSFTSRLGLAPPYLHHYPPSAVTSATTDARTNFPRSSRSLINIFIHGPPETRENRPNAAPPTRPNTLPPPWRPPTSWASG